MRISNPLNRSAPQCVALLLVAGAARLAAQSTPAQRPPQPIPIRYVIMVVSSDSGVIANTRATHVLRSDGIMHYDMLRHRVLLFDSTLKRHTVVADTGSGPRNVSGAAIGSLLAFGSDSTALVDYAARAFVVVDANGNPGNVMAPPSVADLRYLDGSSYGVPGFDARGRLYYRAQLAPTRPPARLPQDSTFTAVDSGPVIRADLDARRLDTVAMLRVPTLKYRVMVLVGVGVAQVRVFSPLPVTDEWAYLPDGTVAVVRGQDYHVDWISPTGVRRSTPKMPFDWRRVTDSEKHQMIDSLQHFLDSLRTEDLARLAAANPETKPFYPLPLVFRADDLPDYYPPIRPGAQIHVDLDGNLWILPSTSSQAVGGLLYDVVNRDGQIIERVQLPAGRALQGFGRGGAIYMSVPVEVGWPRLERGVIRDGT